MLQAGGRRVLVGGNIGVALSAQVDDSTEDTIHVVEASSFQLEVTDTFKPWIAVLLNLSADHLDRHGSEQAYAGAKARLFANQSSADWAVVNADDPATSMLAATGRGRIVLFSTERVLEDGVVIEGSMIVRRVTGTSAPLVPLSSIRLIGAHLVADVVAASAVAVLAGVEARAMTRAVEAFTGLEHALEPVAQVGGVQFVNDSKATNVEAARRAIESFGTGVVVILGGRFKGGALQELGPALAARHGVVVAIGEARPLIRGALGGSAPIHEAADMSAAVRTAFASAAPGGAVVLAPACASFDMFRDYAERGRVFKQEVLRLQEEWNGTREQ
jgi:UDP-N-acetylmuramoylalanine--D-glutamate ligase